jgi:hypothetical protein
MADETLEQHDPERSGQPPHDVGADETRRAAHRRRIMIGGLLGAPVVMTLNARSARAQGKTPTTTGSCQSSHAKNPGTSAHCT